jgi:two-component system, chemotaxis family, sensor kinase CheA
MILDVAAIGARASARPVEARMVADGEKLESQALEALELESAMVIYEVREGERMAMPLNAVERIETVALAAIEFAGGRALLQYRGDLLTLEDEGNVLGAMGAVGGVKEPHVSEARHGAPGSVAGEVTMLICVRAGAKRVGVIVQRVLDVSNGMPLAVDEVEYGGRLAIVKDRVTMMRRESQAWVPMLKEVA